MSILDQINDELDEFYVNMSEVINDEVVQNPANLICEAKKLKEKFSVYLCNQRNADSALALVDEDTLDNLARFNESTFELLEIYKKCETKSNPTFGASLHEFQSHIIQQKEILKTNLIKLKSVTENLESILGILQEFVIDGSDGKKLN